VKLLNERKEESNALGQDSEKRSPMNFMVSHLMAISIYTTIIGVPK
jgi:hypothetical protein